MLQATEPSLSDKLLAVDAACRVFLDLQELLDETANQGSPVPQVLMASLVDHQHSARKSLLHHADHAHLDLQDQLDLRDHLAIPADLATRADLEAMVLLATQDLKDPLVNLETPVEMATLEPPVFPRNHLLTFPVAMVNLDNPVIKAFLEIMVQMVDPETMATLDSKDHPEHQATLASQAEMERQAIPVNPVVKERRVSARNIVPSMVEFSSQMVHDDRPTFDNFYLLPTLPFVSSALSYSFMFLSLLFSNDICSAALRLFRLLHVVCVMVPVSLVLK